jgi:peptidoglycan/LPS O-acetylase OafA/YrhL
LRIVASAAYAVLFFGIAMLDHRNWVGRGVLGDSILGLATFGFIWVLLGAVQRARPTIANKLSRSTAQFSYTLYLVHLPILIFVVGLAAHDTRWIPSAKTVVLALSVLPLVVAYAWLLATATEFRTAQVRGWAESKLLDRQRKTSDAT